MITNIVDFGDTLAKDVMIPRMDIAMVEANISYDELLTEFTENKYARLPVYEETIDHIIGIINLKDFVFYQGDKENLNIKSLMREAHVTYEYKKCLRTFHGNAEGLHSDDHCSGRIWCSRRSDYHGRPH